MAKYINNFLVGADPEFVLTNPPSLVRANRVARPLIGSLAFEASMWGYDHDGWVLESHPKPSISTVILLQNIRASMNQLGYVFGDSFRWRAGAYYTAPERTISLGGHIHIDLPSPHPHALKGMSIFTKLLESLDLLPLAESTNRRQFSGYGSLADIRMERGRFEYRSMCSWLFSQRIALLCLTGTKLLNAAPETAELLPTSASIPGLAKWFALFKGKDDDVDTIFAKEYFTKNLVYNPDRDLKNTWRVDPSNVAGSEPVLAEPQAATIYTNVPRQEQVNHPEFVNMLEATTPTPLGI